MSTIITKLTSRKFLLAVAIFITSLVVIDDNTISVIVSTVTTIAYMFSEAIVDKSRAVKRTISNTANVTNILNEEDKNADK